MRALPHAQALLIRRGSQLLPAPTHCCWLYGDGDELSPCDELLQANLKMATFAFPCACATLLQRCSLVAESFRGSWEPGKESAPFYKLACLGFYACCSECKQLPLTLAALSLPVDGSCVQAGCRHCLLHWQVSSVKGQLLFLPVPGHTDCPQLEGHLSVRRKPTVCSVCSQRA